MDESSRISDCELKNWPKSSHIPKYSEQGKEATSWNLLMHMHFSRTRESKEDHSMKRIPLHDYYITLLLKNYKYYDETWRE